MAARDASPPNPRLLSLVLAEAAFPMKMPRQARLLDMFLKNIVYTDICQS